MRYRSLCVVLGLLSFSSVWANAPVVDIQSMGASQDSDNTAAYQPITEVEPSSQVVSTAHLSEAQRLTRLEQQQNNLANMNLPQQVTELQQELAKLRGQLQVQQYNLKQLSEQQRSFYQDLDRRLAALKPGELSQDSQPDSAASSVSDAQVQDSTDYQAAFNLLEKRQYAQSLSAFDAYLQHYPKGAYISNAHYWMGEIYLVQKEMKSATKAFQTVIDEYPKSSKVPDAKLKLAIIHAEKGETTEARRELLAVQKQYPKSTAAKLAGIRLQQLTQ